MTDHGPRTRPDRIEPESLLGEEDPRVPEDGVALHCGLAKHLAAKGTAHTEAVFGRPGEDAGLAAGRACLTGIAARSSCGVRARHIFGFGLPSKNTPWPALHPAVR